MNSTQINNDIQIDYIKKDQKPTNNLQIKTNQKYNEIEKSNENVQKQIIGAQYEQNQNGHDLLGKSPKKNNDEEEDKNKFNFTSYKHKESDFSITNVKAPNENVTSVNMNDSNNIINSNNNVVNSKDSQGLTCQDLMNVLQGNNNTNYSKQKKETNKEDSNDNLDYDSDELYKKKKKEEFSLNKDEDDDEDDD